MSLMLILDYFLKVGLQISFIVLFLHFLIFLYDILTIQVIYIFEIQIQII